jgi:hypothetical protein
MCQHVCNRHTIGADEVQIQLGWYKPVHLCRFWRYLILSSSSRLDLNLVCMSGVPVVDMLAHSPLLPLTIYYESDNPEITAEDESGVFLAHCQWHSHRDRVRRIFFWMPIPNLGKFITAMDG